MTKGVKEIVLYPNTADVSGLCGTLNRALYLYRSIIQAAVCEHRKDLQARVAKGQSAFRRDTPNVLAVLYPEGGPVLTRKCEQLITELREAGWRGVFYAFVAPWLVDPFREQRLFQRLALFHQVFGWGTCVVQIATKLASWNVLGADRWRGEATGPRAWDAVVALTSCTAEQQHLAAVSAIDTVKECWLFVDAYDHQSKVRPFLDRVIGLGRRYDQNGNSSTLALELQNVLAEFEIPGRPLP
jgi:hypothetical protein